jgi:hypothetical protein
MFQVIDLTEGVPILKSLLGIASVFLLMSWTSSLQATTINVPADQPTIQAGVNAAVDGDTVLVAEGIYHENVVVKNKGITLASHFILDHNIDHIMRTIIDGSTPIHADTGSCVILYGGFEPMLMGFTLTKGNGTNWFDISDSKTYREGGGVLTENNNAHIYYNLIVNNDATLVGPGVTSAGGGGIRTGFGTAEIVGNVFAFNEGLYGAGLVIFQASGQIYNNVVYKNSGGGGFGGAGLWIVASPGVTVENNTVVSNASTTSGGGFRIGSTGTILRNNIVRGNTAATGAQISVAPGGSATVSYSNVQGGFAGTANTSEDPLFDQQNLLITFASACADSGDPGSIYNDVEDTGNPGFAIHPAQGTVRNDKGAYGGPRAIPFPRFTSPDVALATSSVNFGTIDEDDTVSAYISLTKSAYGILSVDSIRFIGTNLSNVTPTPYLIDVVFTDSIAIRWTPTNGGALNDTALIYHNDTSVVSPLRVPLSGIANAVGCCVGVRGNVNGIGAITVADLTYLVQFLFNSGAPPPCIDEGNVNGIGSITVADLTYLVQFLFNGGATPPACP